MSTSNSTKSFARAIADRKGLSYTAALREITSTPTALIGDWLWQPQIDGKKHICVYGRLAGGKLYNAGIVAKQFAVSGISTTGTDFSHGVQSMPYAMHLLRTMSGLVILDDISIHGPLPDLPDDISVDHILQVSEGPSTDPAMTLVYAQSGGGNYTYAWA